jgi:predicted MFS family arabinose efflux permease
MIFFTSTVVSFTVVFGPSTFLPDLMLEKQVERTKISLCVMVTGIGNLIGRLAGGFVSCKYHSRVAMIHGITLFGFGITTVSISFAESLEAFAILSTMIGVFSGEYNH